MPKHTEPVVIAPKRGKPYAPNRERVSGFRPGRLDLDKSTGHGSAHYHSRSSGIDDDTSSLNYNIFRHQILNSYIPSSHTMTSSPISGRSVPKDRSFSRIKVESPSPSRPNPLANTSSSWQQQSVSGGRTNIIEAGPSGSHNGSTRREKLEDDAMEDVAPKPEPKLSSQQSQILDRVLQGENVFFTGSAGVGKSVLLRAIIKRFQEREAAASTELEKMRVEYLAGSGADPDVGPGARRVQRGKLGITASTGAAALNIGGCTLHSWAGIGIGKDTKEVLAVKVHRYTAARERWQTSEALIVDEISMIDGELMDKLNYVAQRMRGNQKPFGGLQLVFCGDFFQLPPVSKQGQPPSKYAFQAKCWKGIIPRANMAVLTEIFRQKDKMFVQLLESLRKGQCSVEQAKIWRKCQREVKYEDGAEPVQLHPTKKEVDRINRDELAKLPGQAYRYKAVDQPGVNSRGQELSTWDATESLNKNTIWPETISAKVGAFVMLVTNVNDGNLANGSTGHVIDFKTIEQARAEGIWVCSRAGQSRHSTTPGAPPGAYPVVRFHRSKYATGIRRDKVLVGPSDVEVHNSKGGVEATRVQVPLILAWALTVHKSQGQTIERLKVDFKDAFEVGQMYVALSRAVSLDTLQIENFRIAKIKVSRAVLEWSRTFESPQAQVAKIEESDYPDEDELDKLLATAEECEY